MIFCYIDESGTSDVPGNTSHFVLAGVSIPVTKWRQCEQEINVLKSNYGLDNSEIHTGWLAWPYLEQSKIPNFNALGPADRKYEVERYRNAELLRLQQNPRKQKLYHKTKKNYRKTKEYVHLTIDERKQFLLEVAQLVGSWSFCRLFAECIDKLHFDPAIASRTIDEQAFEQIVSRFEKYLRIYSRSCGRKQYGLLIHDNNETVSSKHTELMKSFHHQGTLWTSVNNIIETPLFVDSQLTSMVQIADLCSYSLRRYLEKSETTLFDEIFKVADATKDGRVVGVRHFTNRSCTCTICQAH